MGVCAEKVVTSGARRINNQTIVRLPLATKFNKERATMAGLKRQSEGASGAARGTKRPRDEPSTSTTTTDKPASSQPRPVFTSALMADEGDFPRGGGTTLTPLEYKEVRDEGRKEAEKDVEAERKKRRLTQNSRKKGKPVDGGKKADAKDKDAIRESTLWSCAS